MKEGNVKYGTERLIFKLRVRDFRCGERWGEMGGDETTERAGIAFIGNGNLVRLSKVITLNKLNKLNKLCPALA